MIQALKAAFLLRYPVAGLGRVPINLLGLTCCGVLGFGNAGFWFAGIGLETAYLALLATNPRFQRWANAQALSYDRDDLDAKRVALLQQLTPVDRAAMARLSDQCARIEKLWSAQEDLVLPSNEAALRDLQWMYLKLLIARHHVIGSERDADETALRQQIEALERAVAYPGLSQAARESKAATLTLLRRRADNATRRDQMLDELSSDLSRIEAQVALLLENATLEGKPQTVSADLDLASQLLDGSFFGSVASDVAALDAAYGRDAKPARVSE